MKSYSPYDNVRSVDAKAARRSLSGHPGDRRADRPPGRVLGARQVGGQATGREPRQPGRCSRPRWAPATAAPRGATTPGRTKPSSTPSSSTPSACRRNGESRPRRDRHGLHGRTVSQLPGAVVGRRLTRPRRSGWKVAMKGACIVVGSTTGMPSTVIDVNAGGTELDGVAPVARTIWCRRPGWSRPIPCARRHGRHVDPAGTARP